jgi:hypothetical protein
LPIHTIYVRKSSQQVQRILALIPEYASGLRQGVSSWGQILQVRMGLALLGRIKQAFIAKARGGADETGLRWPLLAKSTIAYSRRHPGVPLGKTRAKSAPSWMLTKKQRERWWSLYRQYGGTAPEGATYHKSGRSFAAAIAWRILKHEGAKTLMSEYGNTKVDILRDKGLLFNSLSPGVAVGDPPPPPNPPKPRHQVFRTRRGEVIVGTSRLWAGTHHKGTRRIPQRRLWPEPKRWTASWWADVLNQGRMGVIDILLYLFGK